MLLQLLFVGGFFDTTMSKGQKKKLQKKEKVKYTATILWLCIYATENSSERVGPFACLDLPFILLDKGLALDSNINTLKLNWFHGDSLHI